MRIADVDVLVLESAGDYGTTDDSSEPHGPKRTCLLRVSTDAGLTGYAQMETQPHVAAAIVTAPGEASGFFSGLRSLAVGEDPLQVERLWDRLYRGSFYYGRRGAVLQAISGIDIACWDILGKHTGLPVATLLGGYRRDAVVAYASTLFRETPKATRAAAERYATQRIRAVKFGWGPFGENLGADVALVEAARAGLGEDRELMLDFGWRRRRSAKEAIALVKAIERFRPYWVEEPCYPEDHGTYRRVSASVSTRIAAGEAEATIWSFRQLAEAGIDVLQPDLSRCGGFTVARRIAYLADELNLMVCPHAWGSDLLTAATLQYLAFLPHESFLEFNMAGDELSRGLVNQPFEIVDGLVTIPSRPGIGVDVDEAAVEALRVT